MKKLIATLIPSIRAALPGRAGLIIAAVSLLASSSARANSTLPWYEPFPSSYAEGERLGGVTTSNVWNVGNSPGASSISNTVNAALSYSGLVTTAGSDGISYPTASPSSGRVRGAVFTSQALGAGNPTVYASFLLQINSAPTANRIILSLDSANGSTPKGTVGCWVNTANQLLVGKNSITAPGSSATTALTTGTTHFVVLKYTWSSTSGAGLASLYLDPTPGSNEPGSPTVSTSTGTDATAIQTFYAIEGSASATESSGQFYVDEIRVSTAWVDVTPTSVCTTAGVGSNPTNQSAFVGGTASFSITPTGNAPTLQWQVDPTGTGNNFGNVTDGTGGATANYTTHTLTLADNNTLYRCVVSVACDSSSVNSTAATLTVANGALYSFRSQQSGNWNDTNTWQQSTDGNTWVPATFSPSFVNSNITVRSPDVVAVTAPVTIDRTVIQAGAEVDASGAALTIASGGAAVDCDVSGNLVVLNTAGGSVGVSGSPVVVFENGSKYDYQLAGAPSVPTATWANGSTCLLEPASYSATSLAVGLSGQSFYDLTINNPSVAERLQMGVTGTGTVVRDALSITIPGVPTDSIALFHGTAAATLQVSNMTVNCGAAATDNKFLLSDAASSGADLQISGNLSINGYVDAFGASADTFEFNGTGNSQAASVPADTAHFLNTGSVSWQVDGGAVVVFGSVIPGANAITVENGGTLNCGTSTFTANTVTLNAGVLIGNGTSQLGVGLGSITYGGTLSLPNLPVLNNGDSFLLFGATTYNPGTFASFVPSTPGAGLAWSFTGGTMNVIMGGGGNPGSISISHIYSDRTNVYLYGSAGAGAAGLGFSVTTNGALSLESTNWSVQGTGTCDASGNFGYTNPVAGTRLFFGVHVP